MELTINISIDVDVSYFENKTNLTDGQIAEKVYDLVKEERDTLASEVKIMAIKILNGESVG